MMAEPGSQEATGRIGCSLMDIKTIDRGERAMVLRLVLVGMVAALGVSVPSRPECESWFNSAREWVSAQLADWDTWRPSEADSCRVADAPVAVRRPVPLVATEPVVPSKGKSILNVRRASAERSVGVLSHREAVAEKTARIDRSPRRVPVAFERISVDDNLGCRIALELN